MVPSVIRRALLVTSNVRFTPLNVSVATLSPEPIISVSVFSPLQGTVDRQLNKALVEIVVRLTTMVSARASAANALRERRRAPDVNARRMCDLWLSCCHNDVRRLLSKSRAAPIRSIRRQGGRTCVDQDGRSDDLASPLSRDLPLRRKKTNARVDQCEARGGSRSSGIPSAVAIARSAD